MPKRKTKVPYHQLSKSGKLKRIEIDKDDSSSTDLTDYNSSVLNSTPKGESNALINSNDPDVNPMYSPSDHLERINVSPSTSLVDEFILYNESHSDSSSNESLSDNSSNESVYDNSSNESALDNDCNVTPVVQFLNSWATKHNITISALSDLCCGLKATHTKCFSDIPLDGRTILKTPKSIEVVSVPPGNYIHIGLKKQLIDIFANFQLPNLVGLLFNIDGLPLFKSSSMEVYPILMSIPTVEYLKNQVFPVGLYSGKKKPENLFLFLNPFVEELIDILNNGIEYFGRNIQLLGFCCDAPAKSYIMGIIGHGGYRSCTRCTVNGVTVAKKRVFLELNCPARTNENFLNREDEIFRCRDTPLTEIPGIDFVKSFVIDYMHLVCLGVMRTLLYTWNNGDLPLRLSKTQRNIVSEHLSSLKMPIEFARKPRPLTEIKYWKATEFRNFLLYLGPLVLRDILDDEKYNNFLELHVAMSILLCSTKCSNEVYREYSRKLLIHFVESIIILYGQQLITHNFHNLIHIVDDADHFSEIFSSFNLHLVSAFPFENALQQVKKIVRSKSKPLQQIAKRLFENSMQRMEKIKYLANDTNAVEYKIEHQAGPLPALCSSPQYKIATFQGFSISKLAPDNCCGLKNGSIVLVENIAFSEEKGKMVLIGKCFTQKEDFYGPPLCSSSDLGIYKVKRLSPINCWLIEDVQVKYVCHPKKNYFVVFPMLHCDTSSHI